MPICREACRDKPLLLLLPPADAPAPPHAAPHATPHAAHHILLGKAGYTDDRLLVKLLLATLLLLVTMTACFASLVTDTCCVLTAGMYMLVHPAHPAHTAFIAAVYLFPESRLDAGCMSLLLPSPFSSNGWRQLVHCTINVLSMYTPPTTHGPPHLIDRRYLLEEPERKPAGR